VTLASRTLLLHLLTTGFGTKPPNDNVRAHGEFGRVSGPTAGETTYRHPMTHRASERQTLNRCGNFRVRPRLSDKGCIRRVFENA
jgi:hypothetical protein